MANGTVEALFPYSYEVRDGKTITFSTGERFTLLNKTNRDWWHVLRKGTQEPMYVPASYMKEIINPIYENVGSFDNNRPYNGESGIHDEYGRNNEITVRETDEESTIPDRNYNRSSSADHNNIYRKNISVEEGVRETNSVSGQSNGDKSGSPNVKSLANALEVVSLFFIKYSYPRFFSPLARFIANPRQVCLLRCLKNQQC